MNKQDICLTSMIAMYNTVQQLAATSRQLIVQAHTQVDTEARQQMKEATKAYNFTLSAPNAIHIRLEAAKAALSEAESVTRMQAEAQHQQIQRWQERIAYQCAEAATLLQKDHLSERWVKLVNGNPVAHDAPQGDSPMAALHILVERIDREISQLRALSESFWKMVGDRQSGRAFKDAARVHSEMWRGNRRFRPR